MFVLLFHTVGQQHSLPPGGRWHAERDGRSPRDLKVRLNFIVTRSPSGARGSPPAPAPSRREPFYIHLCLINFPDKHCFCGHKSELRILLSYSLFNLAQVKRFIFVQFFLVVFLCKIINHFAHSFIIITEFYVVVCVKINMLGFFNQII